MSSLRAKTHCPVQKTASVRPNGKRPTERSAGPNVQGAQWCAWVGGGVGRHPSSEVFQLRGGRTAKNMKSVIMSMKSDVVSTLHMVHSDAAQLTNKLAEKSVTRMPCRAFMLACAQQHTLSMNSTIWRSSATARHNGRPVRECSLPANRTGRMRLRVTGRPARFKQLARAQPDAPRIPKSSQSRTLIRSVLLALRRTHSSTSGEDWP